MREAPSHSIQRTEVGSAHDVLLSLKGHSIATLIAAVSVLIGGVALTASARGAVPPGPPGNSFYSPPTRLIPGPHATVIWARALHNAAALSAASKNVLVLYRSVSPSGHAIAVSGVVAVPKGRAPVGGWPVIAWDHGTTGVGDRCAPSKGFGDFEDRDVVLNYYLRHGYAIVQTDYEGLGTPGIHPWLIGISEGRSIVDIVKAAHLIDSRIGTRWLPMGVSQGGHASLWAGGVGQTSWGRGLRLVGIAVLAPSSWNAPFFRIVRGQTTPSGLTGWEAVLLAGAGTAGFDVRSALTPRGLSLWPQLNTKCYVELKGSGSFGGVAPADFVRANADLTRLYKILDANEPGTLHLNVPVFVGQGLKDTSVAPAITGLLIGQLRANGARIDYRTYPEATHGAPEVLASRSDVAAFAARRFTARH